MTSFQFALCMTVLLMIYARITPANTTHSMVNLFGWFWLISTIIAWVFVGVELVHATLGALLNV